jgi:hypothetical protein
MCNYALGPGFDKALPIAYGDLISRFVHEIVRAVDVFFG